MRSRTSKSAPLLVALAAGLLGACQELPHHPGQKVQILQEDALNRSAPADVAIAPVITTTEDMRVPDRLLREVVGDALVKRRYSPLALDYIDSRVVDAAYTRGAVGEDAVCEIIVHAWDESRWSTGLLLEFDIEMRLVDVSAGDGAAGDGRVLWAARYPGLVDATPEASHRPEGSLFRWALAQIAIELAGALPPRDPAPGRN